MPNLYLISQDQHSSWDTFDSAVVVARSQEHARRIHPGDKPDEKYHETPNYPCWATDPEKVSVQYLGKAAASLRAGTVVCASFNAG